MYSNSNVGSKCSEKNIVGPQEVQNPWFLIQLTLTHYTSRSVFFRAHPTPPICLKMPKCAIFSPSLGYYSLTLSTFPLHDFDTFPLHNCTFSPTCLTLLPYKKWTISPTFQYIENTPKKVKVIEMKCELRHYVMYCDERVTKILTLYRIRNIFLQIPWKRYQNSDALQDP